MAFTVVAACVGIERLSSISQQAVVANPGSANFGSIDVGKMSVAQKITISPASGSGDSSDVINGFATSCGVDFMISPPPLPAVVSRRCVVAGEMTKRHTSGGPDEVASHGPSGQQQCSQFDVTVAEFSVVFAPKSPNTQNCQLVLQGSFGMLSVGLTGTGVLPPKVIDVQPPDIDFGDVRVSTPSRIVPVTVRNAGGAPLAITSVSIDDPINFNLSGVNLGAHTLPVNAIESYDVLCQPPTENTFNSFVRVLSDAGNGTTILVPLTCKGTNSALVSDPPSPIDMDTRVDDPIQQVITIDNTGGADSTITAIQLVNTTDVTFATALPTLPLTVPATTGSFSVTVRYAPTTAQQKSSNGRLRITHDGGDDQDVILSTSALATMFGANPDLIDFGPVCMMSTKSMPVLVFANAPGSFDVTGVGSPGDAMFSFSGPLAKADGGHANELQYMAAVTPTKLGVTDDTVTMTTDIPNATTRDFALRVEGLAAGVGANPPLVDYGTVNIGETTLFKPVKITNCETDPLDIISARIEGDSSVDFAVVGVADAQPLARTLQPSQNLEILVIMSPQQLPGPGQRTATLIITHGKGETTATLDGTAVGDEIAPPIEPPGPATYYQCSSGGSGGFLVGFAVFGLLIRRRTRRPACQD